MVTGIMLSV